MKFTLPLTIAVGLSAASQSHASPMKRTSDDVSLMGTGPCEVSGTLSGVSPSVFACGPNACYDADGNTVNPGEDPLAWQQTGELDPPQYSVSNTGGTVRTTNTDGNTLKQIGNITYVSAGGPVVPDPNACDIKVVLGEETLCAQKGTNGNVGVTCAGITADFNSSPSSQTTSLSNSSTGSAGPPTWGPASQPNKAHTSSASMLQNPFAAAVRTVRNFVPSAGFLANTFGDFLAADDKVNVLKASSRNLGLTR